MQAINETIANAIVESIDGSNGTFSVEVEIGNTTVQVEGSYKIDGYREDDYFNGTGAFVVTSAYCFIDSVEAYDEAGDEVEIDCDLKEIESYVKHQIA